MVCVVCAFGFSNIFGYYFFGKLATDQFEQLPKYLFESDWPNSPLTLQKYYILMLANAQQPMYFDGFKIVILNLESFSKVSEPEA